MIDVLVVLAIFLVSCLATMLLVRYKPTIVIPVPHKKKSHIEIDTFFLGVMLGAASIVLFNIVSYESAVVSILGNTQLSPLGVVFLFFSMIFMSIFLDACGMFEYAARKALVYAGNSGTKLFFSLYTTIAILTIFTSNDILILTFTPFIYYFAKHAKIDPKPYFFVEFFAANTWSMFLSVGNTTNLIVASAFEISFWDYFAVMFFPTIAAGIANALITYYLFRDSIKGKIKIVHVDPKKALTNKTGAIVGTIILTLCILTISLAPFLGWDIWTTSVVFGLLLLGFIIAQNMYHRWRGGKIQSLHALIVKIPWLIIPFLLSLFILVEALEKEGISAIVGTWLAKISLGIPSLVIFVYGVASTLVANVINNISMTVAFVPMLGQLQNVNLLAASYATVIGSNLGANLTPIGALAGIMWMSLLKHYGCTISFKEFVKYGFLVTAGSLVVALSVLAIEFMIVF
ncbi:hypothetical protein HYV86_06085 [Candidatus Woesearchaeota archaeon]|nr:hypothetical protein [Candidatus Woesearchaeota archaeon]